MCCHFAWEIVVTIWAHHGEDESGVVGLFSLIYLILPACRTTVEAVLAIVVARKLDCFSIEHELAAVDAVGKTSDCSTKVRRYSLIVLDVVESENYVSEFAIAVWCHD